VPLSTSNSDPPIDRAAARGLRTWLLCALVVFGCVEAGSRYGVPLINSNTRRFYAERAAASRLGQNGGASQVSILFLGNSITHSDIDLPGMQAGLGNDARVVCWAVDDTNYLDWLFGLKRIFRSGARPDYVIVGGRSRHFLAPHVRGNFFAHYMLDWPDLLDAARRIKANANAICSMLIAQGSAFYGSREEIYKRLVTWMIPRFAHLAAVLNRAGVSDAASAAMPPSPGDRIWEMKELCAIHGARLILWIPPGQSRDRNAQAMVEAGRELDVPVLVPIVEGQIPSKDYADGFHLGPAGARMLTSALARELKPLIAATADQELRGCQPASRIADMNVQESRK